MTGHHTIIGHGTCPKGHETNIWQKHDEYEDGTIKEYIQEDCFTCHLNERYEKGGATMGTPSGALWLLTH